jgi:serine/threonine-protein kinase
MNDRRDLPVEGPGGETNQSRPTIGDTDSQRDSNRPAIDLITASTPHRTAGEASSHSSELQGATIEPSETFDLSPPPVIEKDNIVFGKYRLLEKIGEGGMGSVWLVHNLELDRKSALKLIKAEIAQNDKGWRRFKREAQLMAKLQHPNAVAVYDFKRTIGMGYIEMEFVRGRSLDRIVQEKQGEPLPLEMVAPILDQLCSVLQEAHSYTDENTGKTKAIIHRDLKPSNLMIVDRKPAEQNLKVLDFGIAKMIDEDVQGATEVTGAGDILGTPAYMSPEQIRGGSESDESREIDGRSDLYSTGVMIYQLLTGVLPFRGNRMSILAAHLTKTPPPMKEANPKVTIPPGVERVVFQCLEKDPERRPQSARELAERFRSAAGNTAVRIAPAPRRVPVVPVVVAAAVFALVGAGIILSMRSGSSSTAAKTEEAPTDPRSLATSSPDTASAGAKRPAADQRPAAEQSSLWSVPAGLSAPTAELNATEGPLTLVRSIDKVRFKRFKPGIYLPEKYTAVDPGDEVNGFPRVIARADGVRFIRIAGGVYQQGDFRPGTPMDDKRQSPCTPHPVEVFDFYIQETEVTNAEIARFVDPDAERDKWQRAFSHISKEMTEKAARECPAVGLNWATAEKYAKSVGGRLPTESEWEYAARSGGQERYWATKRRSTKEAHPKANLLEANSESPAPVMSFKGEDETDQHVFDLTGNVREWCADPYRTYAELLQTHPDKDQAMKDPGLGLDIATIDPGVERVVRGGSFLLDNHSAMTFNRDAAKAAEENIDLGFRVVIECPRLTSSR